jgi:hypothetical protein
MELKLEITLDQLIEATKQLPANQLGKLKTEINKIVLTKKSKEDFRRFLLQALVFSEKQIALMEEARRGFINQGKINAA